MAWRHSLQEPGGSPPSRPGWDLACAASGGLGQSVELRAAPTSSSRQFKGHRSSSSLFLAYRQLPSAQPCAQGKIQ